MASLEVCDDVSHKTMPHQFRIMNKKGLIYLRGKLTDHCPRQQSSVLIGTESSSWELELEARKWAHLFHCFYSIRDHA